MFGKKKEAENRYIIAVKNYNNTLLKLKEGKLSLSADKSIYLKLLESQNSKAEELKELGKFAKAGNKSLKEVRYYWEGLIIDGYTLLNVEYKEKIPSIDHLCNNGIIKYVCSI